jgi:hypothetical protein
MRLPSPRPHQRACTAARLGAGARGGRCLAGLPAAGPGMGAHAWAGAPGAAFWRPPRGAHPHGLRIRAMPLMLRTSCQCAGCASRADRSPAARPHQRAGLPAAGSAGPGRWSAGSCAGVACRPSTHHAPVGLVQHGCLHRALFQARAPPSLAGLNHCADPHRFCCRGLGPGGPCAFLAPAKPVLCHGLVGVRSLLLI